jgi:hypothetical protein
MKSLLLFWCICLAGTITLRAQFSMTPLTSFGNGDGWLSPGEGGYAYLTTGNTERGIAYGNGHLYLVSRATGIDIRILNALTGSELGALDTTGISGGTFAVDMVCVGGDGAIYVNNLTSQSTMSPLKIYRWANEAAAPTVVYTGDSGLAGARVGDTMAVFGAGSLTRLALGYNSIPSVAGNNGYCIVDPTVGSATGIAFSGTPPNAGDFRLGITFADGSHVIGAQGGVTPTYRYTSFSGAAGTLVASPSAAGSERLLAYAVIGGVPLLAVQSTSDAHVSIFDMTYPATPVLLGTANNTFGLLTPNGNGTGGLAWSESNSNTARLWAMSTSQGIEAFNIIVPTPSPLRVPRFAIAGGGGASTGGVRTVRGTVGQPDTGARFNGATAMNGGFWGGVVLVQTAGAPLLSIALTASNTAVVSWPSPSSGFAIQQNTNGIDSPNWGNVFEPLTDDGTNRFIIVNPPIGSRFYRLFKP